MPRLVVMARLQPERPHAMTTALDRPRLQLTSRYDHVPLQSHMITYDHYIHAAKSLHTVMENLPDEVITMIIALLPARHVKRFALTCRLFAAWAVLLDVVNADTVGDCNGVRLLVHGSKLSDLFQRRTVRSLVLAQSWQLQDNGKRGLSFSDTFSLLRHRPALQHLQLLALEYLPRWATSTGLVLEVVSALNAGVLPQLRSLTLAGIVPSGNVPQLLDGAAKCPLLYYLDLKDLEIDTVTYFSQAATHAAPHGHEPFAQTVLQRSLKLLDLSLRRGTSSPVTRFPGKIRSGLLDSLHNYRAMQVLDVSGALRRPTRFCAAVVKLPELRELYMKDTALFTLPDETLAAFWTGLAALGGEHIDRMGDYHGPRGLQLLDVDGLNIMKQGTYERRQRQMLQACLHAFESCSTIPSRWSSLSIPTALAVHRRSRHCATWRSSPQGEQAGSRPGLRAPQPQTLKRVFQIESPAHALRLGRPLLLASQCVDSSPSLHPICPTARESIGVTNGSSVTGRPRLWPRVSLSVN